ncbi:Uncharacterised protein [Mycobacterium tuberculosis]|nr:Uncharacterised protein [Mycobacterium tuberculosis]
MMTFAIKRVFVRRWCVKQKIQAVSQNLFVLDSVFPLSVAVKVERSWI